MKRLADLDEVKAELDKITLPNIKILLTGTGKVAHGAKEILDHLGIKEVSDALYLTTLNLQSQFMYGRCYGICQTKRW